MNNIKFGLLDFGIRESKYNSLERIQDLVNYLLLSEDLGYSRFWIAEHHTVNQREAWSNPDMLIPLLANCTSTIRIGVAGILLSLYEPYFVACRYKLANNIFSNRIDLGLARGGTSDAISKMVTNKSMSQAQEDFDIKFTLLNDLFHNEERNYDNGNGFIIPPYKGNIPDIWTLGASYGTSTDRSVKHKTNYVRTIFHKNANLVYEKDKFIEYKEKFYSLNGFYPKTCLAFSGLCLERAELAKQHVRDFNLGHDINVVGGPSFFREKILEYKELYGYDEFIFMNVGQTIAYREESIEIISDLFSLNQSIDKLVI